jgi:hypothetical protein
MYKKLLVVLSLFTTLSIHAQVSVSMTLQVPLDGLLQKPQLWNFTVLNNTSTTAQIKISLTMNDAQTNDPILTGSSNDVYVNHGSTVLLAGDLTPLIYDFISQRVPDFDPNGFLPVGQFQVCYKFYVFGHAGYEEVSEECINITVEPISPPLLSMPADGSNDEINMPQFSWLPPAPLNMFNNLSYDFILVEVGEGQTAEEAIQQNMPVYMINNDPDIFLNYPTSHAPLDTGKLYAWQVKANNNNEFAAQSEVWTFKVKPDSIPGLYTDTASYIRLKSLTDASVASCVGTLKFLYTNIAGDSSIQYQISSLDAADLGVEMESGPLTVSAGDNYIDLPFLNDNRLINEHTYLFSVTDSRSARWLMKFIYKTPENK